jgi:hypothetical protein
MPKRPVAPLSLPARERQLRSRLRQLLSEAEGFLHGSLIAMARRCGKPGCRCASDDEARHRSLCLGQTRGGKTTMIHIPADLEPRVRQWVDNFQEATVLLEELSQQGRQRLNQSKQQAAASKPAARHAPAKSAKPKPPRKPS